MTTLVNTARAGLAGTRRFVVLALVVVVAAAAVAVAVGSGGQAGHTRATAGAANDGSQHPGRRP